MRENLNCYLTVNYSRTKRWQRRWFVLFDDGELTYSVDDHFDTIPQAIINLNNVFEITEADAITGNENSIAIVANDGIHFCKGTCREESRMWLDILRLFPQATVMGQGRTTGNGGRAKRSATFPGMRNLGFMSPASRLDKNLSRFEMGIPILNSFLSGSPTIKMLLCKATKIPMRTSTMTTWTV